MNPRQPLQRIFALPEEAQREPLLQVYRAAYGAWGIDWDANTSVMAEDYEFVNRGSSRMPGLPDVLRGRDGYLYGMQQLREVVEVKRIEIDDVLPLPGQQLIVFTRIFFTAGGTDREVEQQMVELHEYRDGELIRQSYWFDRTEGERELGLS